MSENVTRRQRVEMIPAVVLALGVLLSGCSDDSTIDSTESSAGTSPSPSTSSDPGDSGSTAPPDLVEVFSPAPLTPGAYQFSVLAHAGVETPNALVDVQSGFDDGAEWYVVSHDGYQFLGLWTVGQVERDACYRPLHDAYNPGPSVEDLAGALVAQKSTRASAPKPVTLAGYKGLYVELASPRDTSSCDQNPGLWGHPGGRCICSDGQIDWVWILDVDGQRLVVNAAYSRPNSTAADIDKLTSMVDSLDFEAAARE